MDVYDDVTTGQVVKVEEHVCCFGGPRRMGAIGTTITIAGPVGSLSSSTMTANGFSKPTQVCSSAGSTVDVLFQSEFGDPVAIELAKNILTGGSGTVSIAERTKGTKENFECSRRGLCDRDTGDCVCHEGFASGDGDGIPRNDKDHWGIRGCTVVRYVRFEFFCKNNLEHQF